MSLSNCVWPSKTWEPGEICPLNNPSTTDQSSHTLAITKIDQFSKTLIMENLNQYPGFIDKIPQPFGYTPRKSNKPHKASKNLNNQQDFNAFNGEYSAFEQKTLKINDLCSDFNKTYFKANKELKSNRSIYVLPYDDNVYAPVNLYNKPYYLNASKIFSCVAAQAPLDTTLSKFWAAAFANSNAIFCLDTPNNPDKTYWNMLHRKILDNCEGTNRQIGKVFKKEHFEIIYESKSPYNPRTPYVPQRIVKRIFEYYPYDFETRKITEPKKTISHYHFENWTDQRTPELESLKILLDLISTESENGSLPFIHCDYGIDKTGALIALYHLYKQVQECINNELPPLINTIELINEMRKCRNGMVQTQNQLNFISISINKLALDYKNKVEQTKMSG